MNLHELSPAAGSRKNAKRIGRGHGSGQGKTAGKGHKGQKARAGRGIRAGFEGGQMPLQRRIPKRGFNNIFAKKVAIVNVESLNMFEDGTVVDTALLVEAGLVGNTFDAVKILGNGDLTKKVEVKLPLIRTKLKKVETDGKKEIKETPVVPFSATAKAKIESAGGKAEVI